MRPRSPPNWVSLSLLSSCGPALGSAWGLGCSLRPLVGLGVPWVGGWAIVRSPLFSGGAARLFFGTSSSRRSPRA